jgi:hypothetical protein
MTSLLLGVRDVIVSHHSTATPDKAPDKYNQAAYPEDNLDGKEADP